jgi:hypothetical protein
MGPELISLLTAHNMILAGAIFALMTVLKPICPNLFQSYWGARLMPLYPIILGVACALLGCSDAKTWQDRAMVGVLAGFAASHFFKVGKTTLLGQGLDGSNPSDPTPPVPPSANN